MIEAILRPWPWYVAGPLIGLFLPLLYYFLGRGLSVSSSFQDICAASIPGRLDYFRYDWKGNLWRLAFVCGILVGGVLAGSALAAPDSTVIIAEATRSDLLALGIEDQTGLVPRQLIGWEALGTLPGLIIVVGGGFLVGFGTRYADGCTSGHGITGLATLQLPSILAVIGFFAGGLVATHLLLPVLLRGLG